MTNHHSDKFVARLPDGLRHRLKLAAEKTMRSMNSELILALEAHLAAIETPEGAKLAETYLKKARAKR